MYFIIAGALAILNTYIEEAGFNQSVLETYIFQLLGLTAGVLLLMRKVVAIYVFALFALMHLSRRFWVLFIYSDEAITAVMILSFWF